MPGGVQLIHVAKNEKDVFIAVIAPYRELHEEHRAYDAAEVQRGFQAKLCPFFPTVAFLLSEAGHFRQPVIRTRL